MKKIITLAIVICLNAAIHGQKKPAVPAAPPVATAPAQDTAVAAPEPGYQTHDGFFLNLQGGAGYLGFSETAGNAKLTMDGLAGHFGLKLGGAVSSNVILFGGLDAYVTSNPKATVTIGSATGSGTLNDTTYSVSIIGAGIAFYSDSNFFFSVMAGAAGGSLAYKSNGVTYSSSLDTGFGATVNVGKEWWVSKDWGLGAALVGHYSAPKDAGNSTTQLYGGLSFSATYN